MSDWTAIIDDVIDHVSLLKELGEVFAQLLQQADGGEGHQRAQRQERADPRDTAEQVRDDRTHDHGLAEPAVRPDNPMTDSASLLALRQSISSSALAEAGMSSLLMRAMILFALMS